MLGAAFFYRHFPRLVFPLWRLARANYEQEMELLDMLCHPSKTGLDIGAKVGMYTYRIRRHSSDVIAFEPIPLFNGMLKAVFDGKRGRVESVAVSSSIGRTVMRLPVDQMGGHLQYGRSTIEPSNQLGHGQIAGVHEIEVETRTIDGYDLTNVGFIKVDVEGHELSVLDGAVRTIEQHRPNLLIECNDEHYPDGVVLLSEWLRAHDYEAAFVAGNVVHDISAYNRAEHWHKSGIENFICFHKSRGEVREQLARRVKTRSPTARANRATPVITPWRVPASVTLRVRGGLMKLFPG